MRTLAAVRKAPSAARLLRGTRGFTLAEVLIATAFIMVAFGVIAVLARRLRGFAALIEDLALRDVTARLSRFLVMEARRAGSDVFDLPGTRDDVAARLGTVRELISRSLAQLRRAGAISVQGRRIRIIDRRLAAR